MKRFSVIFIALLLAFGCNTMNFRENLMMQGDISLSYRGTVQVSYEPQRYQLGWNDHRNEYRVCADNLAHWFTIRCSERPSSEGQTFKADIAWTGGKNTRSFQALSFTVEKADDSGRIWLWNESERIGVIIKDII